MTDLSNRVISWNTHKTESGFEFLVYAIGYQIPTETLKTGTAKTRAIAKRLGQQWMMYFKAQQKRAA